MNILPQNYTVAQLVSAFKDKRLTINKDYQRSDGVWPNFARSLLVETVLLGYPMPKLTIRQRTDMKDLQTYEEIVDGQQRTKALIDFFNGEFALAASLDSEEFRGKNINTLDESDRQRFVTYPVGADLLVGAGDDEVIEVFRRMNSYTAPLNPEEQRHASFQGVFKWFIYDLRKVVEPTFATLGVFKQKAFIRMQDAKLLTEICHAALNGIVTTDKKKLDHLYTAHDKKFSEADDLKKAIVDSISYCASFEPVAQSELAKPYNFYSLVLAALQLRHPHAALAPHLVDLGGKAKAAPKDVIEGRLAELLEALQDPENPPEHLAEFVAAASETTNTKKNREIRFRGFYSALTNQ
jgi:hypothetical protein